MLFDLKEAATVTNILPNVLLDLAQQGHIQTVVDAKDGAVGVYFDAASLYALLDGVDTGDPYARMTAMLLWAQSAMRLCDDTDAETMGRTAESLWFILNHTVGLLADQLRVSREYSALGNDVR